MIQRCINEYLFHTKDDILFIHIQYFKFKFVLVFLDAIASQEVTYVSHSHLFVVNFKTFELSEHFEHFEHFDFQIF